MEEVKWHSALETPKCINGMFPTVQILLCGVPTFGFKQTTGDWFIRISKRVPVAKLEDWWAGKYQKLDSTAQLLWRPLIADRVDLKGLSFNKPAFKLGERVRIKDYCLEYEITGISKMEEYRYELRLVKPEVENNLINIDEE
jgi:hypothetical protein